MVGGFGSPNQLRAPAAFEPGAVFERGRSGQELRGRGGNRRRDGPGRSDTATGARALGRVLPRRPAGTLVLFGEDADSVVPSPAWCGLRRPSANLWPAHRPTATPAACFEAVTHRVRGNARRSVLE